MRLARVGGSGGEGICIAEMPQVPVMRRQLLQRQRARSRGREEAGKSIWYLKAPQRQAAWMVVVAAAMLKGDSDSDREGK